MAQPLTETGVRAVDGEHAARLARLIHDQIGFVWRLLRGVGLSDVEASSAIREVFEAATLRIGDIRSGSERSFLFSTTLHVAARTRRNREEEAAISDGSPALEDLDEEEQARAMLGALLEQMPLELRVVFILHQIEQLASTEIAGVVGIPLVTAATRLTEAQEEFATHLELDSELAASLLALAHEEQAPEGALARVLAQAGVAGLAPESRRSAPVSARAARPEAPSASHSPLRLAAKWLAIGWIGGLVIGSTVYALSAVLSPAAPRNAVSH